MEKGPILKLSVPSGRTRMKRVSLLACLLVYWLAGCDMVNLGKWKGIERSSADEKYYLVKDVHLSPGSAIGAKETFDHNVHNTVYLYFTPRNEPNKYTAEAIWYDPSDIEFKKIRETYDNKNESKKAEQRKRTGTTRVMSIPLSELYDHKPGLWRVSLYLDGELARKLTFTVR